MPTFMNSEKFTTVIILVNMYVGAGN